MRLSTQASCTSSAKVFVLSFRAEFIFLENSWVSADMGGRMFGFWVFCFLEGLLIAETGFGRLGFSEVGSLIFAKY